MKIKKGKGRKAIRLRVQNRLPARRTSSTPARQVRRPRATSSAPVRVTYRRRVPNPLGGRGFLGSAAVRIGGAALGGAVLGSYLNGASWVPQTARDWAARAGIQVSTLAAVLVLILGWRMGGAGRQITMAVGVGMLAPEAVSRIGSLTSGAAPGGSSAAELRQRADLARSKILARRRTSPLIEAPSTTVQAGPVRRRADIAA